MDEVKKCFTGQSKSGVCGAAAYCAKPYKCCAECDKPCNSRCGWLDKPVQTQQGVQKEKIHMARENLKKARQKASMTQKQVAEYLGITTRAYQHIESGNYLGKIEHWDKLEDLFGIHQRKLRELFPMTNKVIDSNAK